ncbi:glycoside hydrolase family 43 protein [Lentzea albidocapillata]|uniref:Alpha-L-arabinofuranosidase B (ABFB) domain-containing protein n=1 Tax=Lentzea albidocapillata TaxID=40571 RepID=A0A1W1ZIB9_9PSEU|nr:glycoside hydrolase family 43 protein [Lentzea albidocapillata]SMC48249.1 Alpha-L-arabinofuranosidase B (ABFB) domain-containing protein [Lentzea albidocapillata]
MLQRRTFLAGGVAAVALAGANRLTALAAPGDAAYVMGYFTESPGKVADRYALHLAVSTDGLNWMPLNQGNPVATPTAGTKGLRDPFVMRKQNGGFVVLATDLTGTDFTRQNQYIHAWDSADLRSFTGYRRLKMHSMPTHTWAPEAFWDASRNQYGILYSANSGGRDAFYVNYTTDFVNVGAPQLFFDPGFNVLDATVHVGNGTNYLYYKSFRDGRLYGARSSTLNPRSFDRGTYTAGVVSGGIEAPIVVKAHDRNEWWLWGDSFSPVNGELYAWRSGNIATDSWSPLTKAQYTQPLNAKHPTICGITTTEYNDLVSRWGAPTWNRIRSYNFPDHLIRHAGNAARIDPYPFDPYQDAMWQLVPGLASSAGISFRSVNYPDRYLRHIDYTVTLAANDGSSTFAADATFHRVAGLADSTWSSFRSHNFPDRHIRHSGYVLRIDPISTGSAAADRQDATFRIGY